MTYKKTKKRRADELKGKDFAVSTDILNKEERYVQRGAQTITKKDDRVQDKEMNDNGKIIEIQTQKHQSTDEDDGKEPQGSTITKTYTQKRNVYSIAAKEHLVALIGHYGTQQVAEKSEVLYDILGTNVEG